MSSDNGFSSSDVISFSEDDSSGIIASFSLCSSCWVDVFSSDVVSNSDGVSSIIGEISSSDSEIELKSSCSDGSFIVISS